MKDVPFYANRDGDMSCALACYRMVLMYFTDKEYSWAELEALSGFAGDIAAWTVTLWTNLAAQGFDVNMIEAFDYKRYQLEGDRYLRQYFDKPEEYQWQLDHTNVADIKDALPVFLQTVHHEQRSPTINDIDDMLADGYLVCAGVNSRVLNDLSGYSGHMVLVIDQKADNFVVHDPGLPPMDGRIVSKDKFYEAMGGKGTGTEVTGIRLAAA
jgi:hypothetical protein